MKNNIVIAILLLSAVYVSSNDCSKSAEPLFNLVNKFATMLEHNQRAMDASQAKKDKMFDVAVEALENEKKRLGKLQCVKQ